MSVTNLFETRRKAYQLRYKTVTGTYVPKVGTPANDFVVNRVINANAPAVINIPAGTYRGQRILVKAGNIDLGGVVNVNSGTGDDDATMGAATDEFISLEWVNATNGWQTLASNS